MLLKRWITAIILFPILLVVLFKSGRVTFSILISAVSLLSAREYLNIVRPVCGEIADKKMQALFYITCAAMPVFACFGAEPAVFSVMAVNLLLAGLIVLFALSREMDVFTAAARQVLGVVYIPSFLSLLVLVRELDQGTTVWIVWLLLVVFAGDTGAYYTGSYLGKRKLAATVSPKKTVEGAAGGIAASIVMGVVFYVVVFGELTYTGVIFISALLIAVAAQIGDLFASAMKRAGGIKDSGSILPGHGGVLDRIDGLLFAVPVLYILKVFVL